MSSDVMETRVTKLMMNVYAVTEHCCILIHLQYVQIQWMENLVP